MEGFDCQRVIWSFPCRLPLDVAELEVKVSGDRRRAEHGRDGRTAQRRNVRENLLRMVGLLSGEAGTLHPSPESPQMDRVWQPPGRLPWVAKEHQRPRRNQECNFNLRYVLLQNSCATHGSVHAGEL